MITSLNLIPKLKPTNKAHQRFPQITKEKPAPPSNVKSLSFGQRIKNFAKMVEVEVNRACNLRCGYCPNSLLPKGGIREKLMSMETFNKILTGLSDIGYQGKMAFHRYNEPLLAPVEKYISKAKERVPGITAELFTNGTGLTKERLKTLHDAGTDLIIVTQHTPKGFIDSLPLIPNDLLKNVKVKYSDELKLSNRAGILKGVGKSNKDAQNQPCHRPNDSIIFDTEGNALMCCDDYYKKAIMGNVNENPIKNIWESEQYKQVRQFLTKGQRKLVDLCKKCNRLDQNDSSANKKLMGQQDAIYRKNLLKETGSARIK